MPKLRTLVYTTAALALAAATTALAAAPAPAPVAVKAAHQPRFLPTVANLAAFRSGDSPLTPPAPPCPLPKISSLIGPCVHLPEFPATGVPTLGNMAYWGGRVQVHPRTYLVYLGWGRPGAFNSRCGAPVTLVGGATLACDPDGAGKRMADFVSQLGGTTWAGVQSQYYQVVNGVKTYISNDKNQLGGIWVDDTTKTSAKISYHDMAAEAERAAVHFKVADKDLINSNFVIAQPQSFSDPLAAQNGYCAFHDLIRADVDPVNYKGLKPGVPFTNMPYVLNNGAGCGQNLVNSGAAGRLDGFTIALGHEIEEVVTDPAAGDVIGNTPIGGWYDALDANENGDKCAYVGVNPIGSGSLPVPGRGGNIKGNRGGTFPVQSLWSNNAAGGVGYCAGAGTDLPF
ncbi:MAG: hypothetical protein JWM02_959 [Frankiales bacterium]|nr:hypothetical protein [Frankiales bacterium]